MKVHVILFLGAMFLRLYILKHTVVSTTESNLICLINSGCAHDKNKIFYI